MERPGARKLLVPSVLALAAALVLLWVTDRRSNTTLLILGDEQKQGIALVKADLMKNLALKVLESVGFFESEKDGNE